MASTETFTMQTYSFKKDNATQNTMVTLQIRMRHKYCQVHLQTYDDSVALPLTFVREVVVSPVVTSDRFPMPPFVIALPPLRRRSILNALESLGIEGSLCKCLAPSIEKCVIREAERFGYKGFEVVAELEFTTVYGYVHEMAATSSPRLLRRRRIAAKVDVYDREMAPCSMMAASDPKKIV